jgi:hypothetical protein
MKSKGGKIKERFSLTLPFLGIEPFIVCLIAEKSVVKNSKFIIGLTEKYQFLN